MFMPQKIDLPFLFPLLLFIAVLFITACAGGPLPRFQKTVPAQTADSFFFSFPAENGLVFIGAAAKRSSPQKTLRLALEDAARRVAIFYQVAGEYAVENNIGSGAFDYVHNTFTTLYYDQEGSRQYVDALQFNEDTDTLEIENTLIVRTTYPAALPVPVEYRPAYSGNNQKPDWVENPPLEIAGYEVVVGYSGRYASLADTCANAYHNAIFAIIRNINSTSRSSNLLYQNTGSLFGYKTASDNITYSYGALSGFYMLDMWIDPQAKTVWALAIANKSE